MLSSALALSPSSPASSLLLDPVACLFSSSPLFSVLPVSLICCPFFLATTSPFLLSPLLRLSPTSCLILGRPVRFFLRRDSLRRSSRLPWAGECSPSYTLGTTARSQRGSRTRDRCGGCTSPTLSYLNWFYPPDSELLQRGGDRALRRRHATPWSIRWLGVALLSACCIGRPYGVAAPDLVAVAWRWTPPRWSPARLDPLTDPAPLSLLWLPRLSSSTRGPFAHSL